MVPEEFNATRLIVDCGGIAHEVTPDAQTSSYRIQFLETEGLTEGDYTIKISAVYTDHIGRETQIDDSAMITLSNTPLWVKWVAALLLLLILFLIIWTILHIKVLPKTAHIRKRDSRFSLDGEDLTKHANFDGKISSNLEVVTKFHGSKKVGFTLPVKAGQESYLCKSRTKRYAETAEPSVVRKIGNFTLESVMIGSIRYVPDEKGTSLVRNPPSKSALKIKNGTPIVYSGEINIAGLKKSFNVNTKLNFNKKK
jgi:hypothetical protein